jgi:hypothetical protein
MLNAVWTIHSTLTNGVIERIVQFRLTFVIVSEPEYNDSEEFRHHS